MLKSCRGHAKLALFDELVEALEQLYTSAQTFDEMWSDYEEDLNIARETLSKARTLRRKKGDSGNYHIEGQKGCTEHAKLALFDELVEALKTISQGKGRYSRDPLLYAENTIEDMKQEAVLALAKVKAL